MSLSRPLVSAPVPSIFADEYWSAFRKDVFWLLWMGYSRLEHSRLISAEEEEITGELARCLCELLDEPSSPDWFYHYSVHEEPRIHNPEKSGKRRHRLDIRFEHTQSRPRKHYEFEAKRLCKSKAEVGSYLGKEGLGMFLSGKYARHWNEAGMLGYLQSNDPTHWAGKLAKRLSSDVIEPWMPEIIIDKLPTFRTCHSRPEDLPPIRIFHIFLNFTSP